MAKKAEEKVEKTLKERQRDGGNNSPAGLRDRDVVVAGSPFGYNMLLNQENGPVGDKFASLEEGWPPVKKEGE